MLKIETNAYSASIIFESFVIKDLNNKKVSGVPKFVQFHTQRTLNYLVMSFGGISLRDYKDTIGRFNDDLIHEILK